MKQQLPFPREGEEADMSMLMLFRSFRVLEPWTWFASLGFFAFLQRFFPREYTYRIRRQIRSWVQSLNPYIFCDVHEFENSTLNDLYADVEIYLSSLTAQAAHRLNLSKPKNAKTLTFRMAPDQRTQDHFDGATVEWVHKVFERQRLVWTSSYESHSDEKRYFTLQIRRQDKNVLERYLGHIQGQAKELNRAARDLLLYTNSKGREPYFNRSNPWTAVNFVHPATFDTLALDGDLKSRICQDLDRFAQGEAFYRRVGKTWKRGYFLYGPPGTGKSSMIAAIANKMRYDVYDLELTEVESNIELRKLLLHTNNKSVIVIEDIDCSLDLSGQRSRKRRQSWNETSPSNFNSFKPHKEQSKVTLSGLLNFIDGLWSCCGSERIFIFTTNYVEELDPALLRAGRMDMYIHLSYCTFSAFQTLAKNYLQIADHELFEKLRASFEGSYITPAEVSEILIKNQGRLPTDALENLLSALHEHRAKPQNPPHDSDDETEVAEPAPPRKDADGAFLDALETKEQREQLWESLTTKKQSPLVEKIYPIKEAVENKGEEPSRYSGSGKIGNAEKRQENGETAAKVFSGQSLVANGADQRLINGDKPITPAVNVVISERS